MTSARCVWARSSGGGGGRKDMPDKVPYLTDRMFVGDEDFIYKVTCEIR